MKKFISVKFNPFRSVFQRTQKLSNKINADFLDIRCMYDDEIEYVAEAFAKLHKNINKPVVIYLEYFYYSYGKKLKEFVMTYLKSFDFPRKIIIVAPYFKTPRLMITKI